MADENSTQPKIGEGFTATIHYRLTLDDGTVLDDSFGAEPFEYVHGTGRLVPGLERGLEGKRVGETCDIAVEPEDAYGALDPNGEQVVDRAQFPPNLDLKPGMTLRAQSPQGDRTMWIRQVEEQQVTITSNHPLAGQRLNFRVEVVDVREATADELAPPDG